MSKMSEMIDIETNKDSKDYPRIHSDVNFDFSEDVILEELTRYVESTYNQHYVNSVDRTSRPIQVLDFWDAIGSEEETVGTCRNLAIKYLARFGKKSGKNKKDLQKAMHYIMLMMHYTNFDTDNIGE